MRAYRDDADLWSDRQPVGSAVDELPIPLAIGNQVTADWRRLRTAVSLLPNPRRNGNQVTAARVERTGALAVTCRSDYRSSRSSRAIWPSISDRIGDAAETASRWATHIS